MAPWFNLIFDSFIKDSEKENLPHLREVIEAFDSCATEPDHFATWFEEHSERPLCVLAPLKGRKIAILHHTKMEKGMLLGLAGFHSTAPPKAINAEEAAKSLINMGLARMIRETRVPSLAQMLACSSMADLMSLEGEDGCPTVEEFAGASRVQVWPPDMLAAVANAAPTEKTPQLLHKIIQYLKANGHKDPSGLTGQWEDKLQSLWIAAKDINEPNKLEEVGNNSDTDNWFLSTTRLLVTAELGEEEKKDEEHNVDSGAEESPPSIEKGGAEDSSPSFEERGSPESHRGRRHEESPKDKEYSSPRAKRNRNRSGREVVLKKRPPSPSSSSDSPSDPSTSESEKKSTRSHRQKRKRRKDPPSSPSGSSDDDSDSSSSSGTHNDRRRMRRRKERARLSYALDSLAFQGRESRRRERKKNSLLAQWTDESAKLFRLLSAQSWGERQLPKINKFSTKLTSDKKITRAERMLSKESRSWEGDIDRAGMAQFLTEGFLADEILHSPGGFTAFMFSPIDETQRRRTKKERVDHLREVFGDGKTTESSLETLAEMKLTVPSGKSDAVTQLNTAVECLDLLTGRKSIASDGYRYGLSLIKENGRAFTREGTRDKFFFIKFLYLLDCSFQRFCEELLKVATGRDPLGKAYDRGLHNLMKNTIKKELGSFLSIGSPPHLSLPTVLIEASSPRKPQAEGGSANAGEQSSNKGEARMKEEPWMKKNPDPVREWLLPEGKQYKDFFPDTESRRNFPRLKHHRLGKQSSMCLIYAATGSCNRGVRCNLSHYKKAELDETSKSKANERFRETYQA